MNREFEDYEVSLTGQHNYSISFCPICHGAKSVYNFKLSTPENNPQFALKLVQISFEHRGYPNCKLECNCEAKLSSLKNDIHKNGIQILNDSNWEKTAINKSVVEYSRKITLRNKPAKEQIKLLAEWLKYDKSPGLNHVWLDLKNSTDTKLTFKTTWDSSE